MGIRLGFLGNGNMGYAILKGLADRKILNLKETGVYDPVSAITERAAALGSNIFADEIELVKNSDIVLAAVKPQNVKELLKKIGSAMADKLLVSIVAGYDVFAIREGLAQPKARILRVMPNTPAMVGEGVFGLDIHTDAKSEEKEVMEIWLSSLGIVEWIDESLFPVVTGLSGGGPAYAAMFVEALADGGVKYGLKRDTALRIAAQTVFGSAKLILESGMHPAVVKDSVCSPAGTTIEGVQALEEGAFRSLVIKSVEKSTLKALNIK